MLSAKQLAAIFRVRADQFRWLGSNNDPECEQTARMDAYDVLYCEFIAMAEALERFAAGHTSEFTSEADKLRRKGQ